MNRRLQFSLRGLLLAIALASLPFVDVANELQVIRQREAFMAEENGLILYICGNYKSVSWLRQVLGDRPIQKIQYGPTSRRPTREALRRAAELFPEARIGIIELPANP
jgi:hypothetical protein